MAQPRGQALRRGGTGWVSQSSWRRSSGVAGSACCWPRARGSSSVGTGGGGGGKTVCHLHRPAPQGSSKDASDATNQAIQLYLDQIGNKAGEYTVEFKKYDDSTAARAPGTTRRARRTRTTTSPTPTRSPSWAPTTRVAPRSRSRSSTRPRAADAHGVARQHQPRSDQDLGPGRAGQVLPDRQAQLRPRRHHRRLPGRRGRAVHGQGPRSVKKCSVLNDNQTYGQGVAQGLPDEAPSRASRSSATSRGTPSSRTTPPSSEDQGQTARTASTSAASTTTTVASWSRTRSRSSATTTAVKMIGPDGFTGYPDFQKLPEAQGMYLTFAGLSTDELKAAGGVPAQAPRRLQDQVRPGPGVELRALRRAGGAGHPRRDREVRRHPQGRPRPVFEGAGITIPADKAAMGKEIKIDPATGDVNAKDIRSRSSRATRRPSSRPWPFRNADLPAVRAGLPRAGGDATPVPIFGPERASAPHDPVGPPPGCGLITAQRRRTGRR